MTGVQSNTLVKKKTKKKQYDNLVTFLLLVLVLAHSAKWSFQPIIFVSFLGNFEMHFVYLTMGFRWSPSQLS